MMLNILLVISWLVIAVILYIGFSDIKFDSTQKVLPSVLGLLFGTSIVYVVVYHFDLFHYFIKSAE